ncbi:MULTISPECIES: epimerase [Niastella]|uniref:Epimerase n=1 Tax=Niastella soli TaxID=2821487 RepID=A0ABS3Z1F6_9BACT|nr:epimerase [Niastella soli]MBO9204001.1 epimerase [Niastella soli]
MNEQLLNFGKQYIKEVRDNSIYTLENIINGKMKGELNQEMFRLINNLPQAQVELLKRVAYRMIDLTLHNTLNMFEQSDSWAISNVSEGVESINDISDGLAGELYTEDGWIKQFSEYPSSL